MSDFDESFAAIAKIMKDKASDKDTPFAEITDAFKALTAYYALVLKHRKGGTKDDDGFDFASGLGTEDEHGTEQSGLHHRRDS